MKQYRNGLRYGEFSSQMSLFHFAELISQRCIMSVSAHNYGLFHYADFSDVCAAFAASFLIRIARLFPSELNLKQTAKNVEELAAILAEGEPCDHASLP